MNKNKKELDNPIRLPQGVSDFKELVQGNYRFVDKTLLIKDIIEDGAKVILITRPRGFGKTLNLSMLYHFLQHGNNQDENLFKNLEISKDSNFCQKHQNKYPVMFISFKGINHSNYEDAYSAIVELISQLYEDHKYLLEGDVLAEWEKKPFIALLEKRASAVEVEYAMKRLSMYLTKKFNNRPIALVDDYDIPMQTGYTHGYYKEILELMYSIFGSAFKDNSYLDAAVMTGLVQIPEESIFSGFNNVAGFSLLREQFGQYFGFTEAEVTKLIDGTEHEGLLDSIREWYNGYQVRNYALYNPWSIISCLNNNGILGPYWVDAVNNDLITKVLSPASTSIKQELEQLLQGGVVEVIISENLIFHDLEKREEALWSLLLHSGYLKVLSTEYRGYRLMAKVAIPNKEVSVFIKDNVTFDNVEI